MHLSTKQLFFNHVAQTSPFPLAIEIERASGSWIYGADGKKYLDFISGISVSNVGHCHPKVVEAITNQCQTFMHLLVYGELVHAPQVNLSKALSEKLGNALDAVYLVSSGAEATEGALKLAKRYTGRSKIISFKNSYHGSTQGALSVMGNEEYKQAYRPLLPNIEFIEFNNPDHLNQIDTQTACVIIEPIQGEAGIRVANQTWLKSLQEQCNKVGALLIVDEIQTGYGRTGHFTAFQGFEIKPDIVLLSKGMGGGLPIGAFISRREIMQSLSHDPILGHITTFGGNAVTSAAALATLNLVADLEMMKNVQEGEVLLRSRLKHSLIKEIRGKGFLLAIEIGNEALNFEIMRECIDKGIMTDFFLHCTTALRVAPPLNISQDDLNHACDIILSVLDSKVNN